MSKKQKTGSNQEQVEQQNQKLKEYAEQLSKLQTDITAKEAVCVEHGKITLKLAHQAGNILIQAQNLVPHGEWEDWVMENVKGIKLRTAQNYMKLAYEINHREEVIQAQTKNGGKTQLVSLLDEVQNLREAYRVIGIIKNGFRQTDFTEKSPSPETLQKENPTVYEATLTKVRAEIVQTVQSTIKDITKEKCPNWNLADWRISRNGRIMVGGDKSAADCLNDLVGYIADHGHKEVTRKDDITSRAEVVLSEILKTIIQATRPPEPAATKPEDFFMEFGDKAKTPVEATEKLAA